MPQDLYQALLLPRAVNFYTQLIISFNIVKKFQAFVTDKKQAI